MSKRNRRGDEAPPAAAAAPGSGGVTWDVHGDRSHPKRRHPVPRPLAQGALYVPASTAAPLRSEADAGCDIRRPLHVIAPAPGADPSGWCTVHVFSREMMGMPRIYTIQRPAAALQSGLWTLRDMAAYSNVTVTGASVGPVPDCSVSMALNHGVVTVFSRHLRICGRLVLDEEYNGWLVRDSASGQPCLHGAVGPVVIDIDQMKVRCAQRPPIAFHIAVESVSVRAGMHTPPQMPPSPLGGFRANTCVEWTRSHLTTHSVHECPRGLFDLAPSAAVLFLDVARGTGFVLCDGYVLALDLRFSDTRSVATLAKTEPYRVAAGWLDVDPVCGAVYDGQLPVHSLRLDLHTGTIDLRYATSGTAAAAGGAAREGRDLVECRTRLVAPSVAKTRPRLCRVDNAHPAHGGRAVLARGRFETNNGDVHAFMYTHASGIVVLGGDTAPLAIFGT